MNRISMLFALLGVTTAAFGQEGDRRLEDWMQHPEVREIRRLYQQIEVAVGAGHYGFDQKRLYCRGDPVGASLFVDSTGAVRKYEVMKTVGDVIAEARYYYDVAGVLRFSFQSFHSRSGTVKELRAYYDASGQVLYVDERLLQGPDDSIRSLHPVSEPREEFQSLCPESAPRTDVRVLDIQARLFCEETGQFTRDVIGESGVVLWNTIAGGGDAGCASQSTLVLVVIQGPPGEFLGDMQAEALALSYPRAYAREDSRRDTLYHGKTKLGITSPEGRYFVPVFLYDTGCRGIEVFAWIAGARETTEWNEAIPFACGE